MKHAEMYDHFNRVFQIPLKSTNSFDKQGNFEKKQLKKEGESKKKKEVPKEFIKKIKKLGMKVEDAEILYATKIQWDSVYNDNKIHCPETTCDFQTNIDSEYLTPHMISHHKYGEYPCTYANCNYIAYSKVSKWCHCWSPKKLQKSD